MSLKTHGLILTQNNEKMSKSEKSEVIDPEDLIYGTQKLDG
jgi:valyl-tRNA synthetase